MNVLALARKTNEMETVALIAGVLYAALHSFCRVY